MAGQLRGPGAASSNSRASFASAVEAGAARWAGPPWEGQGLTLGAADRTGEKQEDQEKQHGFEGAPRNLGLGVRSNGVGENFRRSSGEEKSDVRGPAGSGGGVRGTEENLLFPQASGLLRRQCPGLLHSY